jgi:hypothetical protein
MRDAEFELDKQTFYRSFDLAADSKDVPPGVEELTALAFHPFSAVRKCAQAHVEFVDIRFPVASLRERILRSVLPKLSSDKPEEFTGAVYFLRQISAMSAIRNSWDALEALLRAAMGDSLGISRYVNYCVMRNISLNMLRG